MPLAVGIMTFRADAHADLAPAFPDRAGPVGALGHDSHVHQNTSATRKTAPARTIPAPISIDVGYTRWWTCRIPSGIDTPQIPHRITYPLLPSGT